MIIQVIFLTVVVVGAHRSTHKTIPLALSLSYSPLGNSLHYKVQKKNPRLYTLLWKVPPSMVSYCGNPSLPRERYN